MARQSLPNGIYTPLVLTATSKAQTSDRIVIGPYGRDVTGSHAGQLMIEDLRLRIGGARQSD
jgi:hypothetical protein